ncbi:hypothetical protein [Polaromonas sp. CG9_12]|nr:hypothetical protein [Polaromonas sp. CG9_12]
METAFFATVLIAASAYAVCAEAIFDAEKVDSGHCERAS